MLFNKHSTFLTLLTIIILAGCEKIAGQQLKISFPIRENIFNRENLSSTEFYCQYNLPAIFLSDEKESGNTYCRITADYHQFFAPKGNPLLPAYHVLIPASRSGSMDIVITGMQDTIISLTDAGFDKFVKPSEGPVRKSLPIELSEVKIDSQVYARNDFYPGGDILEIKRAGTLRDQPLASIEIHPVIYNPVQGKIRVIYAINFTVSFKEPIAQRGLEYADNIFNGMMDKNHLSISPRTKDYLLKSPVKYVILADSSFKSVLQPFVHWKTQMGYKVVQGYKNSPECGSTRESMKAWLSALYHSATLDDPAPSYLLICGDEEQIPAFENGHYTDLYYAEYDGDGDYFPDVYYGRMSAQDTSQLKAELEKTIEYEKFAFPSSTYLDTVLLVAGDDASYASVWGNGQINYETGNYFNPELGIFSNTFLYPSGNLSAEIIGKINKGVGFVNYTGHGYENRWLSPYFTVDNVDTIKNFHKYALFVTNGCNTNSFGYPVCLGEALLRAPQKGAVGHIGGTDDTYWDEDFYWAVGIGNISAYPAYNTSGLGAFDRTMHSHGEPFKEWYATQGQMIFAGNLAVSESGSSLAKYYWEVYTLLGDPSLMIYYGNPPAQKVDIPTYIAAGTWSLVVGAEPGSYVGISSANKFLAAALVDSSSFASLNFTGLEAGENLMIVISKQNRQPVIRNIPVIDPQQEFISCDSIRFFDDANGQKLLRPKFGKQIRIDLDLVNLGQSDASQIVGHLSCSDPYINIYDSVFQVSQINKLSRVAIESAFHMVVSDTVPDQHPVWLDLRFSNSNDSSWRVRYLIKIDAPDIHLVNFLVDDSLDGNGNQRMEPGEFFRFKAEVRNQGHATAENINIHLSNATSSTHIISKQDKIDSLISGDSCTILYPAWLDKTGITGTPLRYIFSVHFLNRYDSLIIQRISGFPDEGFETGNFTRYPWSSVSVPWKIVNDSTLEGKFSARSGRIGAYSNSDLAIQMFLPDTGSLSFSYKVSSEINYDFFDFYLDSELKVRDSGKKDWKRVSVFIPSGWHQFLWRYSKDGNTTQGLDCAWIDNILFPALSCADTVPHAAMRSIIYPLGDSAYKQTEPLTVRVVNRGFVNVEIHKLGYVLDEQSEVAEYPDLLLTPGASLDYTFTDSLKLERFDKFSVTSYLQAPADSITSDDTVSISFQRVKSGVEDRKSVRFNLWPNPCDKSCFLVSQEDGMMDFEILDMSGRIIREGNISPHSEIEIETSLITSGLYFLRVKGKTNAFASKLIIRH